MSGRLNLFQRMMLRWSDLHPYSGVHVVQIPQPLVEARLAESNRPAARGERPDRARCRSLATLVSLRGWTVAGSTRVPVGRTGSVRRRMRRRSSASSTLPSRTSAGRTRSASSPSPRRGLVPPRPRLRSLYRRRRIDRVAAQGDRRRLFRARPDRAGLRDPALDLYPATYRAPDRAPSRGVPAGPARSAGPRRPLAPLVPTALSWRG